MSSESKSGSKPSRPTPAWERAYQDLRRRILVCDIAPGTAISEQSLAAEYEMSPTPVRDAIQRLRQEGLITKRLDRGFEVAPMTFSDIRQLAELRWAIESGIVVLAMKRATPETIEPLRKLALACDDDVPAPGRVGMNREFHLGVARLTGNPRLIAALSQVLDASERYFHLGIDGMEPGKMADTHLEILDAIVTRDVEAAKRLCEREAFENSERIVRALVERAVSPQGKMDSVFNGLLMDRPELRSE